MSHWKKFESNVLQNTKKDLLNKAIAEMGLGLDYNQHNIRNTWGNETVDAVLTKGGKTLSLGVNFKKNGTEEALELTGDFYGTGLNERGFIDKLAQVYQKHNVIQKCEEAGWTVDEVKQTADGQIYIEASQLS